MYFASSQKLRFGLVAVAAVVLLLAFFFWRDEGADADTIAQQSVIRSFIWEDNVMRFAGYAAPHTAVKADTDGKVTDAESNDAGLFVFNIDVAQKLPTRLQLKIGDKTFDMLVVRLNKRWVVLQREQGTLPWLPAIGMADDDNAGASVVVRQGDSYGIAYNVPQGAKATQVYVYADRQLVFSSNKPSSFALAVVPANAEQTRIDIYNEKSQMVQRARLTLPPRDMLLRSAARYSLFDGEVWIFPDNTGQKAEVDELIPGQFVPVDVNAAKVSVPAEKAAPSAHTPPAP